MALKSPTTDTGFPAVVAVAHMKFLHTTESEQQIADTRSWSDTLSDQKLAAPVLGRIQTRADALTFKAPAACYLLVAPFQSSQLRLAVRAAINDFQILIVTNRRSSTG